jgi:hypothetical protein
MTENRNACKILHSNQLLEVLGRNRCENNIKMEFREVVLRDVDWMHVAQEKGKRQVAVSKALSIWVS